MKTEIKYGLLIGGLIYGWLLLEYALGLHKEYIEFHPYVTNISFLIPILLIPKGMKEKRNTDFEGEMTYWQGMMAGFIISLVMALSAVILQWTYHNWINPEYLDYLYTYAKNISIHQGQDPEKVEKVLKSHFTVDSYLMQTFFMSLFAGTVISLIASAFVRKQDKE